MKSLLLSVVPLIAFSTQTTAFELGTELTLQSAYSKNSHVWVQHEAMIDLDFHSALAVGEISGIARLRLDAVDDYNLSQPPETYANQSSPWWQNNDGQLDLRELYWEHSVGKHYWRLGKQQVVWGEADGLKLLDVVNPQSYREFILDDSDDSRIPLWMLNYQYQLASSHSLQLLLIPDTTTHELSASRSPFALSTPLLRPQITAEIAANQIIIEEATAPAKQATQGDVGLRYTGFVQGWDLSLNYLYHTIDEPVVRVRTTDGGVVISPSFERSHLLGSTLSTAFDSWVVRAEFAYETDRYVRTNSVLPGVHKSDQASAVLGLDWQGWSDHFLSVQWFHRYLPSYTQEVLAQKHENTITMLWQYALLNETLNLEWLHIHSLDRDDGVAQLNLNYNVLSSTDVFLGYDHFYGDDAGLFGQYDDADRLLIGVKTGF